MHKLHFRDFLVSLSRFTSSWPLATNRYPSYFRTYIFGFLSACALNKIQHAQSKKASSLILFALFL